MKNGYNHNHIKKKLSNEYEFHCKLLWDLGFFKMSSIVSSKYPDIVILAWKNVVPGHPWKPQAGSWYPEFNNK